MKLPAASSGVSSPELCFFRRKRRGIYPKRLNRRDCHLSLAAKALIYSSRLSSYDIKNCLVKIMKTEILIASALLLLVIGYSSLDYYLLKKGGELSRKLKSIFMGCFFIGIGIFLFCYLSLDVVKKAADLSQNGTETIGTVKDSEIVNKIQKGKKSTFHYNTVIYDGHTSILTLDRSYDVGTKLHIVYSRINPGITMLGSKKSGFIEYCMSEKGPWKLLTVSILSFFCIFIGLLKFRYFFLKEDKLNPHKS